MERKLCWYQRHFGGATVGNPRAPESIPREALNLPRYVFVTRATQTASSSTPKRCSRGKTVAQSCESP